MLRTLCLISLCVGCRLETEPVSEHPEAFEFQEPQAPGPRLDNDEAASLAATALRPGETLAWSGPVFLKGLDQWFALAAAHRDDDSAYSRAYAVSYNHVELDPAELRQLELDTQRSRYGKLDASLARSISTLDENAQVEVVITVHGQWIEYDPPEQADVPIDGETLASFIASHRAVQRERIIESKQELLSLLAEFSLTGIQDYAGVPAIGATLPAWFLLSKRLNDMPSISHVYGTSDHEPVPLGYAGAGSMNEQVMNGGSCGTDCSGLGVIVGIWESTYDVASGTHGTIANNNSRFSSVGFVHTKQAATCCFADCDAHSGADVDSKCAPSQRCVNGKCRGEHVTDVAACVGMTGTYAYGGSAREPIH